MTLKGGKLLVTNSFHLPPWFVRVGKKNPPPPFIYGHKSKTLMAHGSFFLPILQYFCQKRHTSKPVPFLVTFMHPKFILEHFSR
ncbi:hypothetical protein XELAEV_18014554mg [Xenopus laevis]|uniref:Uncharacterized protein n=1 Tax=Xenopus laevis TaxID=8355 RepID=A0A974DGI4_XENLA|nr:hypothetical protein XELAEV_18014554mg [Xenopus laevis]